MATIDYTFDRTIDLQADLGVDPSAGADITQTISGALTSGTEVTIPPGEYVLGQLDLGGLTDIAISGTGTQKPVIRAAPGVGGAWLSASGARGVLVRGLVFDASGVSGGGSLNFRGANDWCLHNVDKPGAHPTGDQPVVAEATDPDGVGIVSRVRIPDGAASGATVPGVWVPPTHSGVLDVVDCHIEGFSRGGVHCYAPERDGDGPVNVIRGLYRNNDEAAVWMGSSGSSVRGAVIVNDTTATGTYRGVWVYQGNESLVVDNTDMTQMPANAGGEALVVNSGSGTVTNSRVRNETGSAVVNESASWSGSGLELTGSGNLSAPSSWVACSGSGCASPLTQARPAGEQPFTVNGSGGGGTSQPPSASFTTSVSQATVSVDASGSSDPDTTSGNLSYEWDFGDGATSTGQTASHTYSSGGDYTVTLTVMDPEGNTDSTSSVVSVTIPTLAPSADFSLGRSGSTITVDATSTTDPDTPAGSLSYEWDFGDGTRASGPTVTHTYSSFGDYTITLTVSDPDGNTSTSSESVSVFVDVGTTPACQSVLDALSNIDTSGCAARTATLVCDAGDATYLARNECEIQYLTLNGWTLETDGGDGGGDGGGLSSGALVAIAGVGVLAAYVASR